MIVIDILEALLIVGQVCAVLFIANAPFAIIYWMCERRRLER